MPENYDSIAARVRAVRKYAKLSQRELAEKVGWKGQSRVGNYERVSNPYTPSASDVELMARATGTNPSWILFGTGSMTEGMDESIPVLRIEDVRDFVSPTPSKAVQPTRRIHPLGEVGKGSFGIEVPEDESLLPVFTPKTIAVVDIARQTFSSRDIVLVLPLEGLPLIRRYHYHHGVEFLPLNVEFQVRKLQDGDVILGAVVELSKRIYPAS